MFHMGKIQETKCFKYSAPFRPFLGKFCQNSAPDLYSRLHFYSAPFEFCGRRIGQLETLSFFPTPASTIKYTWKLTCRNLLFLYFHKNYPKRKNAKSSTCPPHLPLSSKLFSRHINFTMKRAHAMLRAATQIISRKAARSFIYPRGMSHSGKQEQVFFTVICV
jgi:hypothetical protein